MKRLFASIILAFSINSAYAVNLVYNGWFEVAEPYQVGNADGWRVQVIGNAVSDWVYPATGYSGFGLKMIATSVASGSGVGLFTTLTHQYPVNAGQTYTYSDWTKCNVPMKLVARYQRFDNSLFYKFYDQFTTPDWTWHNSTYAITIPAGVKNASVARYATSAGQCVIDSIKFNS